MNTKHRIWAVVGLVLILSSFVCMMAGALIEAQRPLLMNISLIGLGASLAILFILSILRRNQQQEPREPDDQ